MSEEIKKEESKLSLEEKLDKNLQWSQLIYEQNKKIKRRLNLMAIAGYLRLVIIILPIVLALIFLPPLFKKMWQQYGNLLGNVSQFSSQDMEKIGKLLNGVLR